MGKQASLVPDTEESKRRVHPLIRTPPSDTPSAVLGLIETVALDPRAGVEKLERMIAMYERLKARETELASRI